MSKKNESFESAEKLFREIIKNLPFVTHEQADSFIKDLKKEKKIGNEADRYRKDCPKMIGKKLTKNVKIFLGKLKKMSHHMYAVEIRDFLLVKKLNKKVHKNFYEILDKILQLWNFSVNSDVIKFNLCNVIFFLTQDSVLTKKIVYNSDIIKKIEKLTKVFLRNNEWWGVNACCATLSRFSSHQGSEIKGYISYPSINKLIIRIALNDKCTLNVLGNLIIIFSNTNVLNCEFKTKKVIVEKFCRVLLKDFMKFPENQIVKIFKIALLTVNYDLLLESQEIRTVLLVSLTYPHFLVRKTTFLKIQEIFEKLNKKDVKNIPNDLLEVIKNFSDEILKKIENSKPKSLILGSIEETEIVDRLILKYIIDPNKVFDYKKVGEKVAELIQKFEIFPIREHANFSTLDLFDKIIKNLSKDLENDKTCAILKCKKLLALRKYEEASEYSRTELIKKYPKCAYFYYVVIEKWIYSQALGEWKTKSSQFDRVISCCDFGLKLLEKSDKYGLYVKRNFYYCLTVTYFYKSKKNQKQMTDKKLLELMNQFADLCLKSTPIDSEMIVEGIILKLLGLITVCDNFNRNEFKKLFDILVISGQIQKGMRGEGKLWIIKMSEFILKHFETIEKYEDFFKREGKNIRKGQLCGCIDTNCSGNHVDPKYLFTEEENRKNRCSVCHNSGVKLFVCSRCKKTRYCSRQCQVNDYSVHKKTCKSVKKK